MPNLTEHAERRSHKGFQPNVTERDVPQTDAKGDAISNTYTYPMPNAALATAFSHRALCPTMGQTARLPAGKIRANQTMTI